MTTVPQWWRKYQLSRRETIRLVVYGAMELCALFVNFGLNSFLRYLEIALWAAVVIGYFLGGQTKFWLHNSVTWRDHHPTFEGIGRRWRTFTFGNFVGLVIYSVAFVLYNTWGLSYPAAFSAAICTSWVWNTSWNWLRVFGTRRPLTPHTTEEG